MASDAPEPKKGKQEAGVLAGLPATRPSRMSRRGRSDGAAVDAARAAASRAADTREATGSSASGKRTTAADRTRKGASAAPKASGAPRKAGTAKAAAPKAGAAARTSSSSRSKAGAAAKPAAKAPAAAKPKAPAAAKPKPSAAGKPKPSAGTKAPAPKSATRKVAPIDEAGRPSRKPRAVRAGSPALVEPTQVAESRRDDVPVARPAQTGPELVSTVVQAAGELASIGVTVGGQLLKRAASKLPRP